MSNKEVAREAISDLLKQSNIMVSDYELGGLMEAMVRKEHRTIQQTFIREIHKFLVLYADNINYDDRNEASIEFAKKVKELNIFFPYI